MKVESYNSQIHLAKDSITVYLASLQREPEVGDLRCREDYIFSSQTGGLDTLVCFPFDNPIMQNMWCDLTEWSYLGPFLNKFDNILRWVVTGEPSDDRPIIRLHLLGTARLTIEQNA